jgi:threonine/homoserine/homoserine lactone efflux protein
MINFLKGTFIGIAMAAPVGPLALLCIRQSLSRGFIAGTATALGIALGDGFYALIAALGLSAFSSFVLGHRQYFFIAGGLALIIFGIASLFSPEPLHEKTLKLPRSKGHGFISLLLQTMLLTLTNPMTIVSFIAAFSAVEFKGFEQTTQAICIALGIAVGSFFWFFLMSTIVAYFRTRVTPPIAAFIQRISGSLLIVYGILFLLYATWAILFQSHLSSKFF